MAFILEKAMVVEVIDEKNGDFRNCKVSLAGIGRGERKLYEVDVKPEDVDKWQKAPGRVLLNVVLGSKERKGVKDGRPWAFTSFWFKSFDQASAVKAAA